MIKEYNSENIASHKKMFAGRILFYNIYIVAFNHKIFEYLPKFNPKFNTEISLALRECTSFNEKFKSYY